MTVFRSVRLEAGAVTTTRILAGIQGAETRSRPAASVVAVLAYARIAIGDDDLGIGNYGTGGVGDGALNGSTADGDA